MTKKVFEKTKPICRGLKLMQSQYLQGIMKIFMISDPKKTKPKQSQSSSLWPETRGTKLEIRNNCIFRNTI